MVLQDTNLIQCSVNDSKLRTNSINYHTIRRWWSLSGIYKLREHGGGIHQTFTIQLTKVLFNKTIHNGHINVINDGSRSL